MTTPDQVIPPNAAPWGYAIIHAYHAGSGELQAVASELQALVTRVEQEQGVPMSSERGEVVVWLWHETARGHA